MAIRQSKSFCDIVLSAFPHAAAEIAGVAEKEVSSWVDQAYRTPATRVDIDGSQVLIPSRIHFSNLNRENAIDAVSTAAFCLLSRSTDGYIRQHALRHIIPIQEIWVVSYVILLLGDYVIEVAQEIVETVPILDRGIYIHFILENRSIMRLLRARVVSYWDCYYRSSYPQLKDYPPIAALRELETWAA